jgi:TonB family protein
MSTPPPLFSKREKYSLALCSVAFIAFSGFVHTMVGSMGYGLMPHFTVEPTPSPQTVIIISRPKSTPKPTPTPHATPTPPPPKVTPPVLPAVHPPKNTATDTPNVGQTEAPYSPPPTPSVVTPSAPPATPDAQPSVAPTNGPIPTSEGTFKYRAPLDYPEIAIQQHIEGTAVVLVTIGADGALISATIAVSSGNANLDEAALKAARASLYTPYLANGVPTEQQYKIVYDFRLNQ